MKPIPQFTNLHSLHYLPDDASESKDLSKQKPEKAAEMVAILDSILSDPKSNPE